MALLVAGAVLVWRVRREPGTAAPAATADRLATRVLVVYGGVVIVAGTFATAAGPHAGGRERATWSSGSTPGARAR